MTDIHRHLFRRDPDLGDHVCADCPLGEFNEVHAVPAIPDVPQRYEVEAGEAS